MAWSTPATFVTGQIVLASDMNLVTGNLAYLKGSDGLVTIQDGIKMSGTGTASYFKPPVLTTTQRNAIASPANGMMIYNTTDGKLQKYEGAAWRSDLAYGGTLTYLAVPSQVQGDVFFVGTAGTAIQRLAAGTSGYVLTTQGPGANPIYNQLMLGTSGYGNILVTDDIFKSADTERSKQDNTYTKIKEITLAKDGTLRIKFDLRSSTAGIWSGGWVYRNGTGVGAEQTSTLDTYVTKSQDIAGWSANDLCQLYYKSGSAPYLVYIRNFRLYGGAYVLPGATVNLD